MYPPFENSTTRIAISKNNTHLSRQQQDGEQQMFERQIEVYFKLYDKNGDGFISVDDVNKLKESFPEETWIISEDKLMVRNIWFSDPLAPSK